MIGVGVKSASLTVADVGSSDGGGGGDGDRGVCSISDWFNEWDECSDSLWLAANGREYEIIMGNESEM